MNLYASLRVLLLGLLSWAIPFAISLLFYGPSGEPSVSRDIFKSIMVVVGGGSGAWLLVLAFCRIAPDAVSGLLIGLAWAAINLVLDYAVLIPMMHATPEAYYASIGLQYLLMPIMATAMGVAASAKSYATQRPKAVA